MKKLIQEILHFGIVGVFNTLLGYAIIMILYNVLHLNYWVSSGASYVLGSIFSFFANKKLTFQAEGETWKYAVRFALSVSVCYFIAYGVARPLVRSVLSGYSQVIVENLAILLGMGIFIVLNFISQKFFVFGGKNGKTERETKSI